MSDGHIRSNPQLLGHSAYNASLRAVPNYADGTPRKTWEQLDAFTRGSWERIPRMTLPAKPEAIFNLLTNP